MRFTRRSLSLSVVALPLLTPVGACARQFAGPGNSTFAPASIRFRELLEYAPEGDLDTDPSLGWTDFARQLAHFSDIPAEDRLRVIPNSNGIYLFVDVEKAEEYFGITIDLVDRILTFGYAPNMVTIMTFLGDATPLTQIWEAQGYEVIERNGTTIWTIGENGELDLAGNLIQRSYLTRVNNIAFIDPSTLVLAPRTDLLEQVMSAAQGREPNRAEALMSVADALPEETQNLQVMGSAFLALRDPVMANGLAESDDAVGPMPALRNCVTGQTTGVSVYVDMQTENASGWIMLETEEDDQGEQAAKVAEWRLENMSSLMTGTPFSEILAPVTIQHPAADIALISRTGAEENLFIFDSLIGSGDTMPFSFVPEE